MGLYAVSRLAARHGIRVKLRPGTPQGLSALVWLPGALARHEHNASSGSHSRTPGSFVVAPVASPPDHTDQARGGQAPQQPARQRRAAGPRRARRERARRHGARRAGARRARGAPGDGLVRGQAPSGEAPHRSGEELAAGGGRRQAAGPPRRDGAWPRRPRTTTPARPAATPTDELTAIGSRPPPGCPGGCRGRVPTQARARRTSGWRAELDGIPAPVLGAPVNGTSEAPPPAGGPGYRSGNPATGSPPTRSRRRAPAFARGGPQPPVRVPAWQP